MVQKIPPPPPIASQDQAFNRWLLELTAILNDGGGIDPDSIDGLTEAYGQIAANTGAISALSLTVGSQGGNITALQHQVAILNNAVMAINGQLTTIGADVIALQNRAQVLNGAGAPAGGLGSDGDLYLNNTGGSGTRLYGKIGGAWAAIA